MCVIRYRMKDIYIYKSFYENYVQGIWKIILNDDDEISLKFKRNFTRKNVNIIRFSNRILQGKN